MNYLDPIGSVFSFSSTILFMFANILGWPMGIMATFTNGALFYQKGIYGDMCLEIIYFFAMLYGWYHWKYGNKDAPLPISSITFFHASVLLLAGLISIPLLAFFLSSQMHSQVPWIDAFTTIVSLQAMWLSCRKILESWVLWFAIDATSVLLCIIKGLPFHIALYSVYLIVAVIGYYRWVGLYKQQMPIDDTTLNPDTQINLPA